MTENEALQKAIDEYKENLRQEKLSLELSNYSAPLRKTIEENIRDIELEIKWLEETQQYRAIGTIDEFKALKEKKENGLMLEWPCKVGDKAYLVGKGENGHPKVYEGVWDSISMAQRKNGNFEVCGHISYDVYDFFYDDGRTMLHGMYVGQENTKFGKVVFLTKEEAEEALSKSET